jgi:uncharacterized protein (TIGR02118 family)
MFKGGAAIVLKFMVVVCKRQDIGQEEFKTYLQNTHGGLAKKLPGLRKYVQNFAAEDVKRKYPAWDAIVELYFDDWASMETAWASPEGAASDADLPAFVDLKRTTWSVVEEIVALDSQF